MNTYNFLDNSFKNSTIYQEFLEENPANGYLKIRASAASSAIPIEGMKINVNTVFEDNKIIFFEGVTDASGMIDKLTLPAPRLNTNDLVAPKSIIYNIDTEYNGNKNSYTARMYEGLCVMQNINVVPNVSERNLYGS